MSVEGKKQTTHAPEREHADSQVTEDHLDQRLARLREHVSNGPVTEAPAAVQDMEARWPESEPVQYWAHVLAPPEVLPTTGPDPRSQPRDRERAWLREHGREYPGCWLAVYEDHLIAAGPDLRAIRSEARQALSDRAALLHYQPGDPRHP